MSQREALTRAQECLEQAAGLTDQASRELALVAAQAEEVHPQNEWMNETDERNIRPGAWSELRLDLMASTKYAQQVAQTADRLHRWSAGLYENLSRAKGES